MFHRQQWRLFSEHQKEETIAYMYIYCYLQLQPARDRRMYKLSYDNF